MSMRSVKRGLFLLSLNPVVLLDGCYTLSLAAVIGAALSCSIFMIRCSTNLLSYGIHDLKEWQHTKGEHFFCLHE